MSRHVSLFLLRNSNFKFNCYKPRSGFNALLSTSLPNVNLKNRLCSTAMPKNIVVSKHLQALINQPVEEILSYAEDETTTGKQTVTLLKALRMHVLFKGVDTNNLKDDPRFKDLCELFEENCELLPPNLLVSGLRSLLEVGIQPNSPCVIAAEKSILQNISKFSVFNLIGCLYYHHKFTQTSLQKNVVETLVSNIQKRAHELSTPSEVLMLIHVHHLFRHDELKLLEMKMVELMPLLKTQEVCKLLCVMGEKSIRNVWILNAAAFHLRQRVERPTLRETIDVFYVFKKLNFYDPGLYSHLLAQLPMEIPMVNQASLISGLLTVCGHVRCRHAGILDTCGDWIEKNFEACRTRELVSYVLTAAALNYCTKQTKTLLERIIPQLSLDNGTSPAVLLDVTWSLAILDCVPREMLLNVLSSEFYKSLNGGSSSQASDSNKLKLMNLKGVLRKKYPDCVFGCNLYLDSFKLSESPLIEGCRQHILQVLSNFVPKGKYLCANQVTDTGVFIDAELIMDKNMKPLSLQEYGILAKPESTLKDLPKNSKRIALLTMFSKDVTLHTNLLTGVNALGTRLLSDAGYTVVTILYDEFSENKTEVQKAKYLLERIKYCIKRSS